MALEHESRYLPQMEPTFDDAEITAVADCIRSTWVIEAQRTALFEQRIAAFVGARYAVAVPSCTVALAVSLLALGIGPGDEVLVPDLTFVATANAVNLAGATPILVDIDPHTLGMDPDAVRRAVSPRTRALLPVWFNGRAPQIDALLAIAREHDLFVVEDAACALGSRWQGRHSGTFGDLGCFSFNTTKIITTGTGGIIVTDSPALYERCERLKNHGRLDRRDHHPFVGFNFGFSDLLAALGLAQLDKLPQRIQHKRDLYSWYAARLQAAPGIDMLPLPDGAAPWYPDLFVADPPRLKAHLESQGIQIRLFFPPIHTQPAYEQAGAFPHACAISPRGLWLPAAAYLTEADVDRVCAAVLPAA
ncbi:MAG: DegT/DnrJ/EryC1/StrS family aminotransferase [Anaerolineales bacterium]|nr:DegT/DnrJ/EryC1/StrS family aminotransferase [Anaerolineales bacterium]